MKFEETSLPGVILVTPDVHGDERGYFIETYQEERYQANGVPLRFVQDNQSRSRRGILRGLHAQLATPQGKLVRCVEGVIFDAAVDIRRGSPHFGEWVGVTLDSEKQQQLYIPPDFAHAFCVLSDSAIFAYKCTDYYDPDSEISIRWDDPAIGIEWPIASPELSAKDRDCPTLAEHGEALPGYR